MGTAGAWQRIVGSEASGKRKADGPAAAKVSGRRVRQHAARAGRQGGQAAAPAIKVVRLPRPEPSTKLSDRPAVPLPPFSPRGPPAWLCPIARVDPRADHAKTSLKRLITSRKNYN